MINAAPSIDFLVQLTGDRFNPTGIITPLTEAAFEMVQDVGLEFVSYGITDSNGFKLERRILDEFVEYAEEDLTIGMYHPEYGVALLEAA